MKTWILFLSFALPLPLFADQIVLLSGEKFEGEILSEDTREVVFETARTRSRSHRVVHHFQHEIIRSMQRTNPRPEILPEVEAGSLAARAQSDFEDVAYDLQELKDTLQQDDAIDQGRYDDAISKYKLVSDQSYEATKVETNLTRKVEFITLNQNAFELWIVAIEGKVEAMEEKEERLEDALDNELDLAEEQLDALRDRIEEQQRNSRSKIRLGSNRTTTTTVTPAEKALIARVDRAKSRMTQFDNWRRANGDQIKGLEAEAAVLKEKSGQLKTDLSAAKRQLKEQERLRR